MDRGHCPNVTLVIALAAAIVFDTNIGLAQSGDRTGPAALPREETAGTPTHSPGSQPGDQQIEATYASGTKTLIETPVSGLFSGACRRGPNSTNPVANNPAAAQRGSDLFYRFQLHRLSCP